MRCLYVLAFISSAAWSSVALADLYRWVDPETGSVKFSSYPPPWYGDEAKQRRAPKVEVIPAGRDTGAGSEAATAAQEGAKRLEGFEAQRKVLLQQLARPGAERGSQALQKQLEAYSALAEQMDKLDPMGAGTRRTEMQVLIDKIMKGETR
jgi:hypothetical protein